MEVQIELVVDHLLDDFCFVFILGFEFFVFFLHCFDSALQHAIESTKYGKRNTRRYCAGRWGPRSKLAMFQMRSEFFLTCFRFAMGCFYFLINASKVVFRKMCSLFLNFLFSIFYSGASGLRVNNSHNGELM